MTTTIKTEMRLSSDAIDELESQTDTTVRRVLVPVKGKPMMFGFRESTQNDDYKSLVECTRFNYSDKYVIKLFDWKGVLLFVFHFYKD